MKYVQHNSGLGEKFLLLDDTSHRWDCMSMALRFLLPKSDYVLCEPPELWEDVTARVTVANDGRDLVLDGCQWRAVYSGSTDRFRKVRGLLEGGQIGSADYHWAFVIEQKQ